MFKAGDGAVLPLSCGSDYHGEQEDSLFVYRLQGDDVSLIKSVPTDSNNSAAEDTYCYKAEVSYRDVDGNDVRDIVVTPVERRNVGKEYPKKTTVIHF